MTPSEEVTRFLPRLRRFARASCGNRTLADACIERALEKLVTDHRAFLDLSKEEFQFQLFRMVEKQLETHAESDFQRKCWRALILVCIEGFSTHETAQILGAEVTDIQQMVATGEAMATQITNPRDQSGGVSS